MQVVAWERQRGLARAPCRFAPCFAGLPWTTHESISDFNCSTLFITSFIIIIIIHPAASAASRETADVASAERKARIAAEAASRQQAKSDNYRRETLNHNDSTVKALIDTGLVANAARPPGFSCAACSHADPFGAHFSRNTKTPPSVPLPPYYHVEMDLLGSMDVGDRNVLR